jgi:hypothetical protein
LNESYLPAHVRNALTALLYVLRAADYGWSWDREVGNLSDLDLMQTVGGLGTSNGNQAIRVITTLFRMSPLSLAESKRLFDTCVRAYNYEPVAPDFVAEANSVLYGN